MIHPAKLLNLLAKKNLNFITGVPCSIFKDFLNCLNQTNRFQHIIASSEGEAIGIAAGYHLSTKKIPIVYLQNSGLGNAVNPLTSLTDKLIYGIPIILFISWRGEPGIKDEPQHKRMGKILPSLLKVLSIPYQVANSGNIETQLNQLKNTAIKNQQPVALIFKKGQIEKIDIKPQKIPGLFRENALEILLNKIGKNPVVSTTGKTSREIFEIREKNKQTHQNDFLVVGSMGCASSLALGISLSIRKKIYLIDGDGAVLMKMGTLATIGKYAPKNLTHIVIDNSAHESTGGQPTVSNTLAWNRLFKAVGYQQTITLFNLNRLKKLDLSKLKSPSAIVIKTVPGSRENLGRPTLTPRQNKRNFIKSLNS